MRTRGWRRREKLVEEHFQLRNYMVPTLRPTAAMAVRIEQCIPTDLALTRTQNPLQAFLISSIIWFASTLLSTQAQPVRPNQANHGDPYCPTQVRWRQQ